MTLKNAFEDLALDSSLFELLPGTINDADNAATAPLGANATFTGEWFKIKYFGSLVFYYLTLDAEAPLSVQIEWSADGITEDLTAFPTNIVKKTIDDGLGNTYCVYLSIINSFYTRDYYRINVVNGPVAQTLPVFSGAFLSREPFSGTYQNLDAQLSFLSQALLTRSVGAGFDPDDNFTNLRKQGRHSDNCTETLLNGDTGGVDHIWIGKWFPWQEGFAGMIFECRADVPGTLWVDYAEVALPEEGTMTDVLNPLEIPYDPAETELFRRHIPTLSRWVRMRYVNGIAAQAEFEVDTAFLTAAQVLPLQMLQTTPKHRNLAMPTHATLIAEDEDGETLRKLRTTTNEDTDKRGLNSHVTGIDVAIDIKPVPDFEAGVLIVSHIAPTQIPSPTEVDAVGIQIVNTDADTKVFFGKDNVSPVSAGHAILPNSGTDLELDGSVPAYLIAEDAGLATTTSQRNGSTTVNVGTTNPANILVADNTRTTFNDQGDQVQIGGFSAASTLDEIASVRVKMEARKATNQSVEQVDFVSVVTGTAGNVGSVVSGSVTADAEDLYLVAVSRRNASAAVTSVSGMGCSWQQVADVSGAGGDTRLSLWRNTSAPTTNGPVTATLSQTATNAVIGVYRFNDVDLDNAVENVETLNSGGATNSYADSIIGTNRGMRASFVSMGRRTHTPTAGATEQNETRTGTGVSDASLAGNTLALTATGANAYSGSFPDGTVGWSVIAITLTPREAIDPRIRVTHQVGTDPVGVTALVADLTDTADTAFEQDISGDRDWQFSDLSNLKLFVTAETLGDADAEVDAVWIEVTEVEEGGTAVVTFLWVGNAIT